MNIEFLRDLVAALGRHRREVNGLYDAIGELTAETYQLEAERDRYRLAWMSARRRALRNIDEGNDIAVGLVRALVPLDDANGYIREARSV